MARAKRHHYVPQVRLRQFGVGLETERIWRYDKNADAILLLPITGTAVIAGGQ